MNRLLLARPGLRALGLGLGAAALPALAFAQSSSDDGAAAAIFGLVCTCLIFIVSLAIPLALAWWVYNDAKKMANPNAMLWALLTFFTTILGLILYLLLGRNQTMTGGTPPTGPAPGSGPGTT